MLICFQGKSRKKRGCSATDWSVFHTVSIYHLSFFPDFYSHPCMFCFILNVHYYKIKMVVNLLIQVPIALGPSPFYNDLMRKCGQQVDLYVFEGSDHHR